MRETFVGPTGGRVRERRLGVGRLSHGDAADKNATVYQLHPAGSSAVTSFCEGERQRAAHAGRRVSRELPASVPHTLKLSSADKVVLTVVTDQAGGDVSLKVGGAAGGPAARQIIRPDIAGWLAPVANPAVTSLGKATYDASMPAGGKCGRGWSTEIWRFKAVQAGQGDFAV